MSEGIAAAALAIASVTSGISGFGFTMVALTFLSLWVDVQAAVAFLVVHTLSVNIVQIYNLRRHIRRRAVLPMILGGVAGVPLGVLLLKSVDAAIIQKGLGVIVIIFVVQHLSKPCSAKVINSDWIKGVVGLSGGVLMGAFLSGGPPVVMYSVRSGDSKYEIKANMQSFFIFSSIYALGLYIYSGLLTFNLFMESVRFLPVSLLGTLVGIRLFNVISGEMFSKILYLLLLSLGITMLFK